MGAAESKYNKAITYKQRLEEEHKEADGMYRKA